jgi:hypothetical protein
MTPPTQTRPRHRRWAAKTAVGFLTATLVVLAGLAFSPAEARASWQSGVYTGECGKTAVGAFSSWRGATVGRTSGYVGGTTWDQISTLAGVGRCLGVDGIPVNLSVAMLPNGATLKAGAAGDYNTYWTAFGENAVSQGLSHATLRLGWEFNGAWFRWSAAKDPRSWKLYWRQIVNTLRAVPGQHFTFEWSPGLGTNSTQFAATEAWPGVKYVSYVGASVYDVWYGASSASPSVRWSKLYNEPYGLKWLAKFAKSKSKHIGISEWGLASAGSFGGHGSGDDAYFITHFYAWLKNNHASYDIYFNRQHGANDHRLAIGGSTNSTFSKAGAAYRKTFGTP